MYLRRYNSNHFVVLFSSVASTANDLPLALSTKAYFVVPDVNFLAIHPVILFSFDSVIISKRNSHTSYLLKVFFVTMNLSSAVVPMRLL